MICEVVVDFSTYLGGEDLDYGRHMTVDDDDNLYLVGITTSSGFPTFNAYQGNLSGTQNVFMTSLDSAGGMVFSTYFGGSGIDGTTEIALAPDGALHVGGWTDSPDFPLLDPYQASFGGGTFDGFFSAFSRAGSGLALISSSYLGGSGRDSVGEIGFGPGGTIYLAGSTDSPDFPTRDAFQPAYGGGEFDLWLARFSSATGLDSSTYLGGSGNDTPGGLALDGAGVAYLAGRTTSGDFPTRQAYQPGYGGGGDAYLSAFASGTDLLFSTYLGGSADDRATDIVLDFGLIHISGASASDDFPTREPYQAARAGDYDAFAAAFSSGTGLVSSTYLGGTGGDRGQGIVVDANGNLYLAGRTDSSDFPTLHPYQADFSGGPSDIFLTRFASPSTLFFSTYFGGTGDDWGAYLFSPQAEVVYLSGFTNSLDFPVRNAYQPIPGGDYDAFVTKLSWLCYLTTPTPTPSVTPTPTVTPTPSATPTPTATPSPSITPTPSVTPTPTPLGPALELVKTVNQAPEGTVEITLFCYQPTYYYLVTNTGDTYLSGIEIRDDDGEPEDPSSEILIGVIPGPLAPGESAGLEYVSEREAARLNRAMATGTATDGSGVPYPGLDPVTASGRALTYTWIVTDGNDYDGDGRSDMTVWSCRGRWSIMHCPFTGSEIEYFGRTGDINTPGDYDGDGLTDIAIFRPDSGLWAVREVTRLYFGGSSDHPVPGDYSGDGLTDPAVFRRATGLWAIRGVTRIYFGGMYDLPIPGIYDASYVARPGIFRPSVGLWAIRGLTRRYFGIEGDWPVPADYTGDGINEIGIFRDGAGLWAISGMTRTYFGRRFDFPQPADYIGAGSDQITIYRPSTGLWAVRGATRKYWGGPNAVPATW